MKIHILGCGDAFGSGGRNNSGYLLEAGSRLCLLDCGPTTLLAMKRAGFDPRRLGVIFLSHLHGDHCGGVPFFMLEYLYENPRDTPLHVAGPPGTQQRIQNLFQLMFGDTAKPKEHPPIQFHLLEPERQKTIVGIQVFPFRVPHQVREISLGLKISTGEKQILYSGDSAWTEIFIPLAQGVDLFICECCFFERDTPYHMNYKKIQENLSRLKCKELILTHLGQEMLVRKGELAVKVAEDGMVLEL
ncbi:MAG: MBL fold metallo-hydrolase [Candidatus Binatia bacterium]